MKRLRLFTWHIHGSYLYYLSQLPHDIYIPVAPTGSLGYYGRTDGYPWPSNVKEIPVEMVADTRFDCIVYQHKRNWQTDREMILSKEQQAGPQIFIEHDPPRESPTDTRHVVDDPNVLLVHVTHFNRLMWDSNRTPTKVIEHGVFAPEGVVYSGELPRACVVINNIRSRGRRLGLDIYRDASTRLPIDLVGIGWNEVAGGIGELRHRDLFDFMATYRFFFNPIRYTSLGLAVCEAMMIGCPIVGLATTEMVSAVQNGVNGYIETNVDKLFLHMERLLRDHEEARFLSKGSLQMASERFGIDRFVRDWEVALREVTGEGASVRSVSPGQTEVQGCGY